MTDTRTFKASLDLRRIAEKIIGNPAKIKDGCHIYYAPTRQERTPSLKVYPSFFKDFGSDDKGDIFSFLRIYAGLQFVEALAYLGGVEVEILPLSRPKPKPPPTWLSRPTHKILEYYEQDERRFDLWQSYKPLSVKMINKFHLGYGRLPHQKAMRLVVPIFDNTKIIGLRGRRIGKHGAKWISAVGTKASLYPLSELRDGAVIMLVENQVDALLVMQKYPEIVALAPTAGAGTWRDSWSDLIAKTKPKLVIVAYDFDDAGMSNGARVVKKLSKLGVFARLFDWSRFDVPDKSDIGFLIENKLI